MNFILHHIHKRERLHLKKEEYPSKDKNIRFLDNLCLLLSFIQPLSAIPQIYKIYAYQDVSGISIIMWILYTLAMLPFVLYGFIHKVKPMIVNNILWIIANLIIILGIIIYQ